MANGNPRECTIEDYYVEQVIAHGGVTRKIIYRGRRGCADQLTGFPFNRLFLVELKRPRGGKISVHQDQDANDWFAIGARKEFLHTKASVDEFILRVTKYG